MRRRGFLGLIGSLLCLPLLAAEPILTIGIAPHTSARVILEMYQPLRHQLESSLGRAVEIQTAPDFTEFARRALNQEYDLVITTGHQARLMQLDAGYLPLLTYKADFRAVVLVDRKSRIKTPADLRNQTVLGLSRTSLVTLWGEQWLRQQKLAEIKLRYVSAADSVSRQVIAGEAAAAFTSLANYQKLPQEQQAQLRILAESDSMLGRVYLLNKRLTPQQAKIEQALWAFAGSTEGRVYFEQNRLEGYRRILPRELSAMDPFAAETRRALGEQ